MITFIYQLILFFIIIGTYALMRGGYMDIEWNFLLSMYGMFVGYLVMFYFSIYTNTDFSRRTIKIIATISIKIQNGFSRHEYIIYFLFLYR